MTKIERVFDMSEVDVAARRCPPKYLDIIYCSVGTIFHLQFSILYLRYISRAKVAIFHIPIYNIYLWSAANQR